MYTAYRFCLLVITGTLLSNSILLAQGPTDEELQRGVLERGCADHDFLKLATRVNPLDSIPQPFDVLHYDVTMDLTAAPEKSTSGVCRTTLVWNANDFLYQYVFHLRDLIVDSVLYNGTKIEHTTMDSPTDSSYRHVIYPTSTPSAGDTATVTVYYHGTMTDEFGPGTWGGVSSGFGILYAMGVGFSNNYVSTTQHWFPCYDHPLDKATFTGHFLVKPEMMVASNGLLTNKAEQQDGNVLYTWDHIYPAATYLLTFAVGPYAEINIGTAELPMLLYALPGDTLLTKQSFKKLPQMVAGFAERFGPYPFEKVGYVNTPQGAMEHQTMISFPTSSSRRGDSLNIIGAHELAHQWFGDLVSPVDFRHAWLNESFATFCESIWLEELGNFTAYLASQEGKLQTYINQVAPREGIIPLYDFPRAAPSSNYPVTIYEKGALVVGMLRFELGDSLFYAAMREYLGRYAYGNATTEDLLAVCEEVSGKELDWFFDQWVRRSGWPKLAIEMIGADGQKSARVKIRQVQDPDFGVFTNLPIEIGFITNEGIEYHVLRTSEREQELRVSLQDVPLDILVNRGPSLRTLLEVEEMVVSGMERQELNSKNVSYQITPNVISGTQTLTISRKGKPSSAPATLRLFDSAGHRVGQQTIASFPHSVDIQEWDLASGHYLAHIIENGNGHIIPVVIER